MSSSPIAALLASNAASVASDYSAPPTFAQFGAMLQANPANPRVCIITCADPRCIAAKALCLADHPNVIPVTITNAGGSPRKALPDLLAIDSLVSFTDVIIMRHTDCGSTIFREEGMKATLKERVGSADAANNSQNIDDMYFGACTPQDDPKEMCRADLRWLRTNPLVREELSGKVWGGVYDLESGRVEGVE